MTPSGLRKLLAIIELFLLAYVCMLLADGVFNPPYKAYIRVEDRTVKPAVVLSSAPRRPLTAASPVRWLGINANWHLAGVGVAWREQTWGGRGPRDRFNVIVTRPDVWWAAARLGVTLLVGTLLIRLVRRARQSIQEQRGFEVGPPSIVPPVAPASPTAANPAASRDA